MLCATSWLLKAVAAAAPCEWTLMRALPAAPESKFLTTQFTTVVSSLYENVYMFIESPIINLRLSNNISEMQMRSLTPFRKFNGF